MKASLNRLLVGVLCVCALPAFAYHEPQEAGRLDRNRLQSPPPPGKQGRDRPIGQITPNAGPRVADGFDVFLTADFIWWRARQEGTAFALSGFETPSGSFLGRGTTHKPDFSWEPGFKVGLGLNLGRDGWDMYAQYTWYRENNTRSSTSRSSTDGSDLRPMWFITNTSGSFLAQNQALLAARGDWKLDFDVIDLELGRNFYLSQYLTLRPNFGLKFAWQNQKYRVRYVADLNPNEPSTFKMRMDQWFWGLGTRAGLDTGWHLGCGFSILGDFALTAFWTDFDIERTDLMREFNVSDVFLTSLKTENDYYALKGILETSIGLRWETWFKNDDYHFSIDASWEEQIWWSNNQYLHINEESAHGDLTLHGLTLQARFDF